MAGLAVRETVTLAGRAGRKPEVAARIEEGLRAQGIRARTFALTDAADGDARLVRELSQASYDGVAIGGFINGHDPDVRPAFETTVWFQPGAQHRARPRPRREDRPGPRARGRSSRDPARPGPGGLSSGASNCPGRKRAAPGSCMDGIQATREITLQTRRPRPGPAGRGRLRFRPGQAGLTSPGGSQAGRCRETKVRSVGTGRTDRSLRIYAFQVEDTKALSGRLHVLASIVPRGHTGLHPGPW
jgi:hypothetical protein